jgi:PHP family Zn ribbon phosphoesterase
VGRARGRPVKVTASPRLTLSGIIEESVTRKGLDIVTIVDAQSPPVLEEIDDEMRSGRLDPLPGGGLRARDDPDGAGADHGGSLLLLLASEVEVDEPGIGPVHYLGYLPDFETARSFSSFLARRVTNVSLSSQKARSSGEELARWLGAAGGFLVPAHVFTPHKGFFGQGGVDLRQALSERALEAVPAVELGLSADADLADLVPSLAPFTYLTSSDAHSPETIAREHCALDPTGAPEGYDFGTLAKTIREGRLLANYGLDPRIGKYHRAFCPQCGFVAGENRLTGDACPAGGVCPACGKDGLVGGVLDRIMEIARGAGANVAAAARRPVRTATAESPGDAAESFARARPPYVHMIPLRYVPGVGPATLRRLLRVFGTELDILHRVPEAALAAEVGGKLGARIVAARGGTGLLGIEPGAGGHYGRVR